MGDERSPAQGLRRRTAIILGAALAGSLLAASLLPRAYEWHVNRQLGQRLDAQYGDAGWVVNWTVADAQWGQSIDLYRTLYVRFLHPRHQRITPWRDLRFTHKTTTPNRPWHYAVQVIDSASVVTYYWSIREHRWIDVWHSETRHVPPDTQQDYVQRLRHVERRGGLNWPAGGSVSAL